MTRCILILSCIFLSMNLKSEPCDISIHQEYDSIPFVEFAKEIEQTYHVNFYFKEEWIDSLFVSNHRIPNNLSQILNDCLKNSSISYYLYNCNKIILSKNYEYVSGIPDQVFQHAVGIPVNPVPKMDVSFLQHDSKSNLQNKRAITTIGDPSKKYVTQKATISGKINDTINDTPIAGAIVFFDDYKWPAVTDGNGFYSVSVQTGSHTMHIRCIGKEEKVRRIVVYGDGVFNETLEDDALSLQEVYIYANKESNIRDGQLGIERLDGTMARQIPSSVGEADIFKMALLLPGVQSVGEGASGFNVRGGAVDQNLILIDNSPIYNPSHLFGFFSTINAEMVEDFELYKSSYPAYFGGRLSSILDVNLRKGDFKKFSIKGGISPVTGKLLIEGPIIKNRVSFIISGRSTYSDWILKRIHTPMMQNSQASFYDMNAKVNADMNSHNSLQLNAYFSHDYFKLNSDTTYNYNNSNGSISWKHTFNEQLILTATGLYSEYSYDMGSRANPRYAFDLDYRIQHYEGKIDVLYMPDEKHKIRAGANSIKYSLNPGTLTPGTESIVIPLSLNSEQGVESAAYINDEYAVNNKLLINAGLRYSLYYALGPAKVYQYAREIPRSTDTRTDSILYSRNEITARYNYPEFRISARYELSENNSIKASFAGMTQYIHMLTNTMAVSPTDIWTLSSPQLKPQRSRQYSVGYYRNFRNNMFETSIETYYKETKNLPEFKPGAKLLVNPDLETDLLAGIGKAFGVELMVRKKSGKLNGWASYTYARSLVKVDGRFKEEKINYGKYYPASHDKPHDFTFVSNYRFSRRISFSTVVKYSTGHPITYPVGWYTIKGRELLHYSNRNEFRIPDYFRMDLALNLEGNLKVKKLAHSSWTFSVYNLTGRNNAYSIYFISDPVKNIKGYKLSVFTKPIPSITYNFKF